MVPLLLLFAAFSAHTLRYIDPGAQSPDAGPSHDERLQLILKSADDWNRGDIEGFVRSYEEGPETTFVGSTVMHGTQDILARYRRAYPDRQHMGKLTFSELNARTLSPTLAIVTGRFTLERSAQAGGKATGLFTLVLRRGRQGWRIIHDHTSPQ